MDEFENELYYFNRSKTWEDAQRKCTDYGRGYASENILAQVIEATEEVRVGKALYEQDGVAFYQEHNNYEFLFALFYVYAQEQRLRVLDFGGSLGSTYFHYRNILPSGGQTEWCIVEQEHYVNYGKQHIKEINFYNSIEECLKEKQIDIVLFSSSLQYLEDPLHWIKEIKKYNITWILLDQTAFCMNNKQGGIFLQHVPASIYKAVYPVHIFSRNEFIEFFEMEGYQKMFEWRFMEGYIPIRQQDGLEKTIDRGFLWKRKK